MIDLRYEPQRNRAAVYDNGSEIGECTYVIADRVWVLTHTFVDSHYKGQNLGMKLVDLLADEARKIGIKLLPECSFVVKLFEKFPDKYEDVAAGRL